MPHIGATPLGPVDDLIDLTQDAPLSGPSGIPSSGQLARHHTCFVDNLADPNLWPPMEHRGSLTSFLGAALQRWPAWPSSIGLDIAGQNAFNEETSQSLHVSTSYRQQRLLVTYQCIKGDDTCSMYLCREGVLRDQCASEGNDTAWQWFPSVPNGFFDAVAAGLAQAGLLERALGRVPYPSSGPQLRTVFTEWLRQRPPGEAPQVPTDVTWLRWEAAAPPCDGGHSPSPGRPLSPQSPFGQAPPFSLFSPFAPSSSLDSFAAVDSGDLVDPTELFELVDPFDPSGLLRQLQPLDPPQAAGPASPPSTDRSLEAAAPAFQSYLDPLPDPCTGPGHEPATEAEARQLIQHLRTEQWHQEMLAVLLPSLTWLSSGGPNDRRELPWIRLVMDGGSRYRDYGRAYHRTNASVRPRVIAMFGPLENPHFSAHGSMATNAAGSQHAGVQGLLLASTAHLTPARLDSWTGALQPRRCSLNDAVRRMRLDLADVLDQHPTFVRLCMTISRLWPGLQEPDLLLRQCIQGRSLTWEGRQVLARSCITSPLTSETEVHELFTRKFKSGGRRSELYVLGYDMLRANQRLGLLGRAPHDPARGRLKRSLRNVTNEEVAWHLHIYGSWSRLASTLGKHPNGLRPLLGPRIAACEELARNYAASNSLLMGANAHRDAVIAPTSVPTLAPVSLPASLPVPSPGSLADTSSVQRPGTKRPHPGDVAAGPVVLPPSNHYRQLPPARTGVAPASTEEALALAEAVRSGVLKEEFIPVICHALVHCDFLDLGLLTVPALSLRRDGAPPIHFGNGYSPDHTDPFPRYIYGHGRAPAVRFRASVRAASPVQAGPFDGLNGLLMAYCALARPGKLADQLRSQTFAAELWRTAQLLAPVLADMLAGRTQFVRLCLTLHRLWPDHPNPAFLLRQCTCNGQLTWEGQQVLDPSLISRSLETDSDIRELSRMAWEPGMRRELLFYLRFPLLRANELLSPLGLTTLAQPRSPRIVLPSSERLNPEGGWLLYVHGTWGRLSVYLRASSNLKLTLPPAQIEQWEKEAQAHRTAALWF